MVDHDTLKCQTIKFLEVHLYIKTAKYRMMGMHGGVVVKALHYKLAGCGFDSRWCHWNFSVT
jgi:hypothetical protein